MKTSKRFLILLVLALSLCACSHSAVPGSDCPSETEKRQEGASDALPEASGTQASTVSDMVGRQIRVYPGSYRRIVCIGAGALRMYSYLGDISLLCGVEDIDNPALENRPQMFDSVARPYMLAYESSFSALPSCGVGGPNAQSAEAEKILACRPDLVISEYEDAEKSDALQAQLGVPVLTLRGGQSIFDERFSGSLRLLGTVLGKSERAEALLQYISAEQQAIADRTAGIAEPDKPAVYICGLGNWGTTNHLMTGELYPPFEAAHVKNVVTGTGIPGVFPLDAEKFVALGPAIDIMIIDAAAVKNILPLLAQDPDLFSACKAWQNGEVYLQLAFNAYYTNYELTLANSWFIGKTVCPERFADVDMTAKLNEITEMFLGTPLADRISACPASYGGYQRIDTAEFFR